MNSSLPFVLSFFKKSSDRSWSCLRVFVVFVRQASRAPSRPRPRLCPHLRPASAPAPRRPNRRRVSPEFLSTATLWILLPVQSTRERASTLLTSPHLSSPQVLFIHPFLPHYLPGRPSCPAAFTWCRMTSTRGTCSWSSPSGSTSTTTSRNSTSSRTTRRSSDRYDDPRVHHETHIVGLTPKEETFLLSFHKLENVFCGFSLCFLFPFLAIFSFNFLPFSALGSLRHVRSATVSILVHVKETTASSWEHRILILFRTAFSQQSTSWQYCHQIILSIILWCWKTLLDF